MHAGAPAAESLTAHITQVTKPVKRRGAGQTHDIDNSLVLLFALHMTSHRVP